MARSLFLIPTCIFATATFFLLLSPLAQGASKATAHRAISSPVVTADPTVVTILSGAAGAVPLRAVADMAAVLDDVDRLRVLPVIGRGDAQNVSDLLHLGTIDLVLAHADSLEAIRQNSQFAGAERSIGYVARLFDESMHVVAKADVIDLRQLAHRKVAVGAEGSASRFSAERIFARLGIEIEPVADEFAAAIDKVRSGEIAALATFGPEPDAQIAALPNADHALRLVPAPWDQGLGDLYVPAVAHGPDYLNLMGKDEQIESVAVGELLVAPVASADGARAARLAAFVDAFFSKLGDLQQPPRHPAWRDVNLAAKASGWTRVKPAQDWLDGKRGDELRLAYAATNDAPQPAGRDAFQPAPATPAGASAAQEFERFRRFVQKKRGKSGDRLSQDDTVLMFQQFQKWSGAR